MVSALWALVALLLLAAAPAAAQKKTTKVTTRRAGAGRGEPCFTARRLASGAPVRRTG